MFMTGVSNLLTGSDKDYMLYFGRHPNDEQGTAMRIRNVKFYRRWVD